MRFRIFKWLIFVLLFIFALVVFFYITWPSSPSLEIAKARMSLTSAEKENRSRTAELIYREAERYYDSAMAEWSIENKKIFFNRDYSRVKEYASKSNSLALSSIEKSKDETSVFKKLLAKQRDQLIKEIEHYDQHYGTIQLNNQQRSDLTSGKMLLQEGILAYNKNNWRSAEQKFDSSGILLRKIIQYSAGVIEQYFENYQDWKKWADKTVENSRKHKTYCIIIDKYARKCNLYKNGLLQSTFNIELSSNWIGDKSHQGDKATPEGIYKVVSKKMNGETRYYKALLLNFPNEEDKKQFKTNKKNGLINRDAKIGGLIEIHGHGGKGGDWTDGCAALKDTDMDQLYSVCNSGTEVTILGSLVPYDEILRQNK